MRKALAAIFFISQKGGGAIREEAEGVYSLIQAADAEIKRLEDELTKQDETSKISPEFLRRYGEYKKRLEVLINQREIHNLPLYQKCSHNPTIFSLSTGFHRQEKERPKAALKNTTFGLKTLYFKPFDGYPYFTLDINTTVSTWHEKTPRVPIYMRFSQPLFGFNKLLILKHLSKTKNYDKTAIFRTREHILDTKIACFFLF